MKNIWQKLDIRNDLKLISSLNRYYILLVLSSIYNKVELIFLRRNSDKITLDRIKKCQ